MKTGAFFNLESSSTVGMLEEYPSPKGEVLCFAGSRAGDVDAIASVSPKLLAPAEAGEFECLAALERSSHVGDSPLVIGEDPVAMGLEWR
jgi:hypothetical protein